MKDKKENFINDLNKIISQKNVSADIKFQQCKKLNDKYDNSGVSLQYSLPEYMRTTKNPLYKKFKIFFCDYATHIRKIACKSPLWKKNIDIIIIGEKKEGREYTRKKLNAAYNYTLDFYDPNKKRGKDNWLLFWSLIDVKNGKITGVYLGDTVDVEIFYEYLWEK